MSEIESGSTLSVVILAAGAGTRMNSSLPKPLHAAAGRPMLAQVLSVARQLAPEDITIVCSPDLTQHLRASSWADGVSTAIQDPPRGTADAVRTALDGQPAGSIVLVLYADHPLITAETLAKLIDAFDPGVHRLAVLTCTVDDAAGYGRICRDSMNRVQSIVEQGDDDTALRTGQTEINSGFMVLDRRWAEQELRILPPNARKNEHFLTDLVAVASSQHPDSVTSVEGTDDVLVGVNNRLELSVADDRLRERKNRELMAAGVTLLSPESNRIDLDVEIGVDTTIGPGCVLEAGTRIGSGCRIGPHAVLRASVIGDRVSIASSTIEHSSIDSDSDVGPYSHLRGDTRIGSGVHIGNFAELKNATVAASTRIGHVSYIGDAALGEQVNIGAGTITCNFDGVEKHRTEIGAGAFIGSDTMLIAPVTIGRNARTGAGAVVNRDVAEGDTVVGMPARRIPRHSNDSTTVSEKGANG
jgi:bifunctional UDP-N-acetylglucosamine pyrophosphorylase/glucosamine-1-phosphate N-acetyltransferase